MGRLDLLDVYRDEDYTWRYDSSVDSPLMVREAGDSIALRTTEEPQVVHCSAVVHCNCEQAISVNNA